MAQYGNLLRLMLTGSFGQGGPQGSWGNRFGHTWTPESMQQAMWGGQTPMQFQPDFEQQMMGMGQQQPAFGAPAEASMYRGGQGYSRGQRYQR